MIKLLIMFSVTFFLTGCVGIGVVYSDKSNLDCKDLNLTQEINYLTYEYGEPEIINENNNTKYIFKKKYELRGIVPMVGIGIPLLLPIGTNTDIIKYSNDKCFYQFEKTTWHGGFCGIISNDLSPGCSKLK